MKTHFNLKHDKHMENKEKLEKAIIRIAADKTKWAREPKDECYGKLHIQEVGTHAGRTNGNQVKSKDNSKNTQIPYSKI